jgi:mannose-6-phosphate isomerase-like protein (cupin superfamily)
LFFIKKSKASAEHYSWGKLCDGWHLVKNHELSVIQERMPPHTSEVKHYHKKSRQFFFVLSGMATMDIDGQDIVLGPQEGIEVPSLKPHQIHNKSDEDVEFLVVSQPASHGDRVLVE